MTDLRTDPAPRGLPEDDELPEPRPIRRLRLMVSLLLVVLILGMIAVSAALVIRLSSLSGPGLAEPVAAETLSLPPDSRVMAVGRAGGEVFVVTQEPDGTERLHAFDAQSGARRSVTEIRRSAEAGATSSGSD